MAKLFVYGKGEEEISSMPAEEFISKYASSRARRTYRKISDNPSYKRLQLKVRKARDSAKGKVIRTHVREAVILPEWIGMKFGVHNGKEFVAVEVTPLMIGRRLGDFAHTTKRVQHSGPGVGATRGSKFVPLK